MHMSLSCCAWGLDLSPRGTVGERVQRRRFGVAGVVSAPGSQWKLSVHAGQVEGLPFVFPPAWVDVAREDLGREGAFRVFVDIVSLRVVESMMQGRGKGAGVGHSCPVAQCALHTQ